jgi:hypothetical protein
MLAVALGVMYQSAVITPQPIDVPHASYYVTLYPAELLEWARANSIELMKIERKLLDLIQDEKATSANCKPMSKKQRDMMHNMAKFYGVNSYEYDPEPQRYVSFVKLLDSKLPSNLLSQRCRVVNSQLKSIPTYLLH